MTGGCVRADICAVVRREVAGVKGLIELSLRQVKGDNSGRAIVVQRGVR